MKCCNIKWANNKHWFNINQILHLINVETTSSIVLTLIHSKSIQHCIYIVYKMLSPKNKNLWIHSLRKTWKNTDPLSIHFCSFPSTMLVFLKLVSSSFLQNSPPRERPCSLLWEGALGAKRRCGRIFSQIIYSWSYVLKLFQPDFLRWLLALGWIALCCCLRFWFRKGL
jgi:hypothetical protein